MDSKILSFFAKCNFDLNFTTIFWHEPLFLISPNQKNLMDLFIDDDITRVNHLIKHALENQKELFTLNDLHLRNPKSTITINVMTTQKSIFVFGIDMQQLCHTKTKNTLIKLSHNL